MTAGDGDGSGRWLMLLVLALLGVSTAGNMIARQGGGAPAGAASAGAAFAPGTRDAAAAEAVVPNGLLRPLALIADAIEPSPMFAADESGRLRLSPVYRDALTRGGLLGAATDGAVSASGPPAAAAERVTLFDQLRVTSQEQALVAHVQTLTRNRGIDVRFVVATLPDWVDSSLQWTFDPMLDALQVAAGQMGYVPVAFHIPDAESAGQERASAGRARQSLLHESEPGVVLFRRAGSQMQVPAPQAAPAARTAWPGAPPPELLVVLLVGETATGGIHPQALASALDLVLLWQREPVRVLGPTYSGSAESLRTALQHAVLRHGLATAGPGHWFEIVSGSATSPANLGFLDVAGVSTFRATTRSDDDALLALTEYLGGIDADWRCGRKVALLVEANTTWGRRFYERRGPTDGAGETGDSGRAGEAAEPSACARCRAAAPGAQLESPLLPCATILPFPLHVSRLRGEANVVSRAQAELGLPAQSKISLPLDEPGAAIDRLPSVSPVLTAANVETMLRGVFGAIEERNITAVGVFATDKRDHVFLAQEIARRTPNVLPFTLESNLIYLHPDVASYVRGTVVASAYSLYDRTQFLTRPTLANHYRQQFGSVAAHGAFNALLALMGEPEQMLDYDAPAGPGETVAARAQTGPCRPGQASCAPPVWISVAARNALLPLTSVSPGPCPDQQRYTLCADASGGAADAGRPQQDYLGRHALFRSLAALLVALLGWHVLFVLRLQLAEPGTHTVRRERLASRFACEAALVALGLWLLKLALVQVADARHWPPAAVAPYYGAACAFGATWVVQRAIEAFWRRHDARGLAAIGGVALFVLAVLAWCLLGRPGAMLAAVQLAVAAGLLALFADFDPAEWRSSLGDVQRWRRWPVLLGLGAFVCLLADLALRRWDGVEAILWAERSASLASFASPAPVIVFLCGAVYWWGAWNLRRVQLMRLPEIEVGVGELIEGRARRAGTAPKLVFERPTLSIGPFVAVPVAGLLVALVVGRDFVASVDGRLFGGFLLLGAACVVAIMGHTLAHSAHLGRAIFHTLHALHRHPATAVFEKLGQEPFHWRLGYREPRIPDFEPLVRRIQLTAGEAVGWTEADCEALRGHGGPDPSTWQPLAGEIVRAMKFDRREPATGGAMRVEDWSRLDELTRSFKSVLRLTRWRAGYDAADRSAAFQSTIGHMEYVVLFHGAVVLRDLLTRLVSGFTAVLGGLLLLTLAHLFYTFQGRAFWLALDWVAMGVAALVAVRTLFRIERDVVLSRLWQTQPGRVSLFGGLSWRMLAYLGVTLVTLFAVFFPEVGGGLLRWLEPARRALP